MKIGVRVTIIGLPQERIAKRVGQTRDVIRDHLGKMPVLAFSPNADLSQGFTVYETFVYLLSNPINAEQNCPNHCNDCKKIT